MPYSAHSVILFYTAPCLSHDTLLLYNIYTLKLMSQRKFVQNLEKKEELYALNDPSVNDLHKF